MTFTSPALAMASLLHTPYSMPPFSLPNRIVMAPLTRLRAGPRQVPLPITAEYYAQRASAAFIIGEATYCCPEGYGYLNSPGIATDEQVEGHKRITKAVHDQDGRIFLQLWHVGRISHPSLQPDGQLPVAPSAITPHNLFTNTATGMQPMVTPRALETEEIKPKVVDAFAHGARNAKRAGYDGVEIHAANGYLIEQFLCDNTNQRTDAYGGCIENRYRLLKEVCEAVVEAWDGDGRHVGVRLSPSGNFNDIHDSDRLTHMRYVVQELNMLGLGYLHVVEPRIDGGRDKEEGVFIDWALSSKEWRKHWSGTLISAGGLTRRSAEKALREGDFDLACWGRQYISNPDLVERFAAAAAAEEKEGNGKEEEEEDDGDAAFLNPYDRSTFYGGGAEGYTDFPRLGEEKGERMSKA